MGTFAVPLVMQARRPFNTTLKVRGEGGQFIHEAEDFVVFLPLSYKGRYRKRIVARIPKGRAKPTSHLRRGQPTREPYDRMLIVCEGKKTEPNYFNEMRQEARISTLHIRILHSQEGPQPLQVVNSAESEFQKTKQFEKVFAVFDRDDHKTYADAIAKAESLNGKLKNDEGKPVLFEAIVSVPCFELWLLLHFANIQSYFHRRDILDDEVILNSMTWLPSPFKVNGMTIAS